MLVQGTLEHDARVRKSARTLAGAGFDVHVLGAVWKGASYVPADPPDDFELRVVRVLPRRLVQQRHRAAAKKERLETRLQRLRKQAHELADANGTGGLSRRLRRAAVERRRIRTRKKLNDARRREKKLIARTKTPRSSNDPLHLAAYEAAWWPHVRRLRPDVVHVHSWSGLGTARRAARDGARWIFDVHDHPLDGLSEDPAVRDRVTRQIAEHAMQADVVITVSQGLADDLVADLGLPRPPALVHNTPPRAHGSAPDPGLRAAAGVARDVPLLVYAGALNRMRRLEVVLAALALLGDVHLALVASHSDWRLEKLLEQAGDLGVEDRVHAVPRVAFESVVPFIAEADVAVHPLSREPAGDIALPNKLFEYLHAGLPMVVSDSPTMADFVLRHRLGAVAPLDDVGAWAEAIRRTLAAPPYREHRFEEWQRLKDEWSWEHQGEILVGIYRELLASRSR